MDVQLCHMQTLLFWNIFRVTSNVYHKYECMLSFLKTQPVIKVLLTVSSLKICFEAVGYRWMSGWIVYLVGFFIADQEYDTISVCELSRCMQRNICNISIVFYTLTNLMKCLPRETLAGDKTKSNLHNWVYVITIMTK